jgi:HK97 family phage major capsid protein
MDIAQRIKDFEATRGAKQARMVQLQETAANAGRTKDASEQEEFDTLKGEIAALDNELSDLRHLEKQAQMARPVVGNGSEPATNSKGSPIRATVLERKLDPGIRFARVAKALSFSRVKGVDVERVARDLYPDDALVAKAAVAAGSATQSTWGDFLVSEEGGVVADFAEWLRPQTILGRFGSGGIPSLRNVPFRTRLLSQTSGGAAYWVGEGEPKPLTKFEGTGDTIEPTKIATIAVLTEELIRDSSPSADAWVRDQLGAAARETLDVSFINPALGSVGARPASITNGLSPIPATGTDAAGIRGDVAAIMTAFINANNPPQNGVWIMPSTVAMRLGLVYSDLGVQEFPGVSLAGGTFQGLPVIASEYVPSTEYGAYVILANASDIYLADEGGYQMDVSREASLEMKDQASGEGAISNDSVTPTPTTLVSLWQTNSVGFRVERTINWKRRRNSGVQILSGVNWGIEE